MKRMEAEAFKEYYLSGFCKDVVEEAKNVISSLQDKEKYYIAFSGGKDSTVLLDIALSIFPFTTVYIYHGSLYVPKEYLIETRKNYEYIASRRGVNKELVVLTYSEKTPFRKALLGKFIPALKDMGYKGVLLGFRKEESSARKRKIEMRYSIGKQDMVFPIANFTSVHVWAYIVGEGLPYLRHYDKYGKVEGILNTRTSILFHRVSKRLDKVLSYSYTNILEEVEDGEEEESEG